MPHLGYIQIVQHLLPLTIPGSYLSGLPVVFLSTFSSYHRLLLIPSSFCYLRPHHSTISDIIVKGTLIHWLHMELTFMDSSNLIFSFMYAICYIFRMRGLSVLMSNVWRCVPWCIYLMAPVFIFVIYYSVHLNMIYFNGNYMKSIPSLSMRW